MLMMALSRGIDSVTVPPVTSDSRAPEREDGNVWRDPRESFQGSSESRTEVAQVTGDIESDMSSTEGSLLAALRREQMLTHGSKSSGATKPRKQGRSQRR